VTRAQRSSALRTRHGYTLVELGVVVLLTSLLIFGMVRWLVGIGASASAGIEDASDQRAALVFDQIAKDLRTLVHCQAAGTDARVVQVQAGAMTVITDSDGDGTAETVSWRISGGTIQRGMAAMGADCQPGEVTAWTDWLDGAQELRLSVYRDGVEESLGTLGACTTEIPTRCRVALIGVRVDAGQVAAAERRVFDIIR
jgi:type II secretory pathway component PulJ